MIDDDVAPTRGQKVRAALLLLGAFVLAGFAVWLLGFTGLFYLAIADAAGLVVYSLYRLTVLGVQTWDDVEAARAERRNRRP
jgi:hypothetical protein